MTALLVIYHIIIWTSTFASRSHHHVLFVNSFQHHKHPGFSPHFRQYRRHHQNSNKAKKNPRSEIYKVNKRCSIPLLATRDASPHQHKDLRRLQEIEEEEVLVAHKASPVLSRRQWISKTISTCATATSAVAAIISIPKSSRAATSTLDAAQDTRTVSSGSTSLLNNNKTKGTSTTTIPSTFPKSLCDPSVSSFRHPSNNRIVHILGTAHISSASAEVAGQLVRDIQPSAVFVELDAKRVGRAIPKPTTASSSNSSSGKSLDGRDDEQTGNNDKVQQGKVVVVAPSSTTFNNPLQTPSVESGVERSTSSSSKIPFNIREKLLNKASQIVGNSIKGLYQKLESEGFSAGEEFIVAVREGLNVGSQIVLGDQDVEVTLRRLTEALSKTDMKKLLAADAEIEQNMKELLPADVAKSVNAGAGGSGEMTKEEFRYFVETIKAKENVRVLMDTLKSVAPEVYQAMVGERDVYMANGLDRLNQFDSIVAVMGVAHVDGVERTLKERGWEEVKYPKQCI
mmetsp:Transcript_4810/g.9174  ORF Transcript_4810/g.9174 Transcript_4810/m.9174 type:complete len:512 (+) Transcript_4810:133-1668(+)